ncbi:MAG: hypothetical protein N2260_08500 [Syntrophobacterales bacterium]|nr:hypothetical protein [Syntrophobacterales bacterium]
MSIRELAKELYRATKRVEELERRLLEVSLTPKERESLEAQLKEVRAERDRLREMLDKAKA